jgi:DNA-binding transcriptional ArsR family regulator
MTTTTRQRSDDVFAAIGDPTRRRVLDILSRESLPAGEIAARFRTSRPAISQHLSVLRRVELVRVDKRGREQIYRLNPEPLRKVRDWIEQYDRFWSAKLSELGSYLDSLAKGPP